MRLDELRKMIATELGEVARRGNVEIEERRARLARVEQKIAGLIHFIREGEQSEYVRDPLRDLEAQAKSEKAAIKALLATADKPIALPSPAELAEGIHDLEQFLDAAPVPAGEQLATLFGGELRMVPQAERHYVAEGGFFPLRLLELYARTPGTTKARPRGRAGLLRTLDATDVLSRGSCAGAIRWLGNEVSLGFREVIVP